VKLFLNIGDLTELCRLAHRDSNAVKEHRALRLQFNGRC